MREKDFEEIFFENLNRRIGIDARSILEFEENEYTTNINKKNKNKIETLKNNVKAFEKVNTNRTRGGKKGRKGFDFEYLEEQERKNRYIKEEKNRKVKLLDNNDEIIDIIDGRDKLQLKNVSNINSIDFDKYIEGGAKIIVPKDKYELFQKQLDDKILRAKTKEEKLKLKKYKKKLKASKLSTFDANNPNLYLVNETLKTTYYNKMKDMILAHLIKVFTEKIKTIANDDSKGFLEVAKEILDETILFIKEVWAKELGKNFVDLVLQLAKDKILNLFKKGSDLIISFLNSLEEIIGLLKKLFLGEITFLEFIKLGLRIVVYTIIATLGIALEEFISKFIGIPIVGDLIATVLSVGLVSLATVMYTNYIESILFGFFKIGESHKKMIIAQGRAEEIKKVLETELPRIIENREKFNKEFNEKLKQLREQTDNSFKKLNDRSLSLKEFEDEMSKLGDLLGIDI